jgi:hypothetical protein
MKTKFFLTVLTIFPIVVMAQYNMNTVNRSMQMQQQQARNMIQQMNNTNQKWASERQLYMQQQQMRSMMAHTVNKIEAAENKLAKEERNLTKLQEKAKEKEAELNTDKENLLNLANSSQINNDGVVQKNINKSKGKVAKSEEKLSNTNAEIISSSKKIEDFKKEIQTSKLEKEEIVKKQEEEKRLKKEEKEGGAKLKKTKVVYKLINKK